MHDSVFKLVLALYGHPDSGGNWEQHCEGHLRSVGFQPLPEWPSCYWNADAKAFLVVYVDDFKLAARKNQCQRVWSMIRKGLNMEDPEPVGLYLGRRHIVTSGVNKQTGRK